MANLAGFDKDSVGNLINHYTRHAGDPDQTKYTYANQKIDPTRTHLNYAVFERDDPNGFVDGWIDSVDIAPRTGKKATNVISNIVLTLPKNDLLKGREREFFEVAYQILLAKIPRHLVLGAWVHMDETSPHMHFAFCPVIETAKMVNDKTQPMLNKDGTQKRDKKGTPRWKRVPLLDADGRPVIYRTFGQSRLFTKQDMREFHPWLEAEMEKHFGFKVGIELDESQKVEKALSKVDQKDLDAARAAIVEPAQAEADQIVEDARVDEVLIKARQAVVEQQLVETRDELGTLNDEVAEKRHLSGVLDSEISEKTENLAAISAETTVFSEKRDAAKAAADDETRRLELLRQRRADADARVADLRERVEAARAAAATAAERSPQPAGQSVAEDARTLLGGRNLKAEEERLRSECDALGERQRALRDEVRSLGSRIKELGRNIETLKHKVINKCREGIRMDRVPRRLADMLFELLDRERIRARMESGADWASVATGVYAAAPEKAQARVAAPRWEPRRERGRGQRR